MGQDKDSEIKTAEVIPERTYAGSSFNTLTYSIPPSLKGSLIEGSLVLIPYGKKQVRGIIKSFDPPMENKAFELKPIKEVFKIHFLPQGYLELLNWVSEFYLCDLWTVIENVLPLGLFSSLSERIFLKELDQEVIEKLPSQLKNIVKFLSDAKGKSLAFSFLKSKCKDKNFSHSLNELIKKGIIEKTFDIKTAVKAKKDNPSKTLNSGMGATLSEKQKEIFKILKEGISKKEFQEFLIHGITGSGKTEVYLSTAKEIIDSGQQVIFLLPEISLTVQLIERVKRFLGDEGVVVWHSNLSDGQRVETWNKCLNGEAKIVIGARSAVFAPLNRLGLIIIDEQHDQSYKSGNRPFYDAREIARQRAKKHNCIIISGSATPSIKDYSDNCKNNSLFQLTERFHGNKLPEVEIVDMRRELNDGNRSVFSRKLRKLIDRAIENKEQVILFLNRRGHSSYVFCRDCGYAVYCDSCSVPMTYHSISNTLKCHHCEKTVPSPKTCPACGSTKIKHMGLGTQKLEEEVQRNFPKAEVIRLDRDVSSKRNGMQEVWEKLSSTEGSEKAQILVGTQLVAKGLDLARVTVVGVMNADAGLHQPDIYAHERCFQLLTQVAGRAGRHDKEGRVIFQTYTPENPIIQFAAQQDYSKFFNFEIKHREKHNYPPYCHLVRIIGSNEDLTNLEKDFRQLNENLLKKLEKNCLLGPAACPIEKIKDNWRMHLIIKTNDLQQIRDFFKNIAFQSRFSWDIQPVSFM